MKKTIKVDPKLKIEKLEEVCKEPKIVRITDFDDESLSKFEDDFNEAQQTEQPVIPVVIDSFGGSVYSLLGCIATIETATVPVATIVTSKAMSAGAMLFCFGSEGYRYMHPEATLMIHDMAWGTCGKVEDMKVDTNHVDEMNNRMYKRVSRQLGHEPGFLSRLVQAHNHVDWFLTAKEARKYNIANHLRVPEFVVEIGLKISFDP